MSLSAIANIHFVLLIASCNMALLHAASQAPLAPDFPTDSSIHSITQTITFANYP